MPVQIVCKDIELNKRKLKSLNKKGEKAIQRTGKDYAKRAPAWIKKAVKQVYTVDSEGLSSAGPTVRISGSGGDIKVDIKYKGRRLTLKHFKFAPRSQAPRINKHMKIPGEKINFVGTKSDVATVRRPKSVKLRTTIIKGQTVSHGNGMFVISGKGNNLPWQKRGGGGSRGSVQVVHTVGMPQMVGGDRVQPIIDEKLQTETQKRFENAIKQCF